MKIYLLSLMILLSFSAQAQSTDVESIEFKSLSRVYFEHVTITADSLIFRLKENHKNEEVINKRAISKKEWKSILKDINSLSLESIPNLESPTMKRSFDGARHSSLKIITTDTSYEHLFDDENPHKMLIPLLECIKRMTK
ncbi:MAG: hypothetical protein ABJH98_08180 [Reichenbachiella sp.]|uniref:hypothetical protein n=1 Tax=Reichenbachiella sp. TaxID=2184521 RepID=UPI003297EAB6